MTSSPDVAARLPCGDAMSGDVELEVCFGEALNHWAILQRGMGRWCRAEGKGHSYAFLKNLFWLYLLEGFKKHLTFQTLDMIGSQLNCPCGLSSGARKKGGRDGRRYQSMSDANREGASKDP